MFIYIICLYKVKFYGLGFQISVKAYRGVAEIRTFIKNNIYKKGA